MTEPKLVARAAVRKPPMALTLEGSKDFEIRQFILDAFGPAVPDIDVSGNVIDGHVLIDTSGSPQIEVTVHDHARRIVRSGAIWDDVGKLRVMDVELDGLWWRLTALRKEFDDLVLTLELREVAWLRDKVGPRKAESRADVTRAQYIYSIIRSVKQTRIPVIMPELKIKQPIAQPKDRRRQSNKKKKDDNREPGFGNKEHVAGLGPGALNNVAIAMEVWRGLRAPQRAIMAGLVAGFGETGGTWKRTAHNDVGPGHDNVFQSDTIRGFSEAALREQAKYFMIGGRSYLAGGAIQYIKDHPYATLGEVAAHVEISDGSTAYYNTYRGKAKKVYDAYHGGVDSSTTTTLYKQYQYKVDKDETYWDAIQRLAEEVKWLAFFSVSLEQQRAAFYFISETRLMKSRARYTVSEDTPGVTNIDFEENYRKRVQRATIECRIDKWEAPPGTIVIIEGMNPSGSKRWLVESIQRSLFSADATITVKRPHAPRKEPAPDSYQKDTQPGVASGGRHRGHVGGDVKGLHADFLQFLQEVAGETNEEIFINDGFATSGHVAGSNHYEGFAGDVNVGGDARSNAAAKRKGDNIAIAGLVVCGVDRAKAKRMLGGPATSFSVDQNWNGYLVEIGWLTLVGGDHYNHVHFGFDKGPNGRRRDAAPNTSKSVDRLGQDYKGANA